MKKLFAVALLVVSGVASAASLNLFGGTVNAGSVGGTQATTQDGSGAALIGLAATGATASASQQGAAGGVITPTGVVVEQGGVSQSSGVSGSGALGVAAGGSTFGSGAGNVSGATGSFGTVGIGLQF